MGAKFSTHARNLNITNEKNYNNNQNDISSHAYTNPAHHCTVYKQSTSNSHQLKYYLICEKLLYVLQLPNTFAMMIMSDDAMCHFADSPKFYAMENDSRRLSALFTVVSDHFILMAAVVHGPWSMIHG